MKENVLVTGGAGFIGSHVAADLQRRGFEVVVLDDLSGGDRSNVPPGVHLKVGSIVDPDTVESLFQSYQFAYVFHFAAYAAEGLSHFIKRFNYENNLIGSVNLINAAVNYNIKCFVFASSIAVYGSAAPPVTEETIPSPEDSYGISKYAVEMELQVTHAVFGLNYVIFRAHNVYGEHQNIGDRYRNVVGIFMNQILQGKPMTIFGDGTQTRAFSYISDLVHILSQSIQLPAAHNQIFNIGADTPLTINQLAQLVAQAMGVAPDIVHLDPRHEVLHAYSSHDKIRRVFGDYPATPPEEGIHRMASWVKLVGARQSSIFGSIEIAQKMPPSWAEASGIQSSPQGLK